MKANKRNFAFRKSVHKKKNSGNTNQKWRIINQTASGISRTLNFAKYLCNMHLEQMFCKVLMKTPFIARSLKIKMVCDRDR